ncbi:MAG: hypothetical protein MUE51_12465 [Thermoleophilia bacterium]|nr:hypothetical protein [Thermoleophilia bacterium]
MRGARGAGAAEYLGLVAAVGLLVGALLVVRPHLGGRTPPVRPIPAVVRLLGAPVRLMAPAPAPAARPAPPRARRAPRVRRRPPPPPPRPVLMLPEWLR